MERSWKEWDNLIRSASLLSGSTILPSSALCAKNKKFSYQNHVPTSVFDSLLLVCTVLKQKLVIPSTSISIPGNTYSYFFLNSLWVSGLKSGKHWSLVLGLGFASGHFVSAVG